MPTIARNLQDDTKSQPKTLASWYAQGLCDALGDRLLMFDNSSAPSLELLRFRSDFAHDPRFESALREVVDRLANFRDPAFARVRAVQRLEPDGDLALISNYTAGKRLSEVLAHARGAKYAAALIRQLAPALVRLQQDAGICHGVLDLDRIIVSPEGRLTIVEHPVGHAINALNLSAVELASIGMALPPRSNGASGRLDAATDWYHLGLVAMSVLIGRPVIPAELPQLAALLADSSSSDGHGDQKLSPAVRQWLDRALQMSGPGIGSGSEAQDALEELRRTDKSGESRRRLPSRRETSKESATSASPAIDEIDLLADLPSEVDEPSLAEPRVLNGAAKFSRIAERLNTTASVRQNASAPSTFEIRPPTENRPPPPVRGLFQNYSHEKSEQPGTRERHERAEGHERLPAENVTEPPRHRQAARAKITAALAAGLALTAIVEAVIIAGLTRAVASRPPEPPVLVQTAASGENVLVSRDSKGQPALGLTVAPDLRWVRVNTRSSEGVAAKPSDARVGTLRISSPIELKVLEQSRVVGSVPGPDLKLAPGRHAIELVSPTLGYRLRQVIDVEAGQTTSIHVAPPLGSVTIDAAPWAEVWIDGQPVGRTPLGPLPLALGEHEITFRHPAGTKDRQKVIVKSDASVRVVGVLR